MSAGSAGLSQRIGAILSLDPSAPALEFERQWRTWGNLATTVDAVGDQFPIEGIPVGILLRSRPASVGLLLGVLRAGGCAVAINPQRGVDRTRQDISQLKLPFIAGEPGDIATLSEDSSSSTVLETNDVGCPLVVRWRGGPADPPTRPGVAVRMLTSGTTGPPKRIDLSYDTLERVLAGAKHYESNRALSTSASDRVSPWSTPLSCIWAVSSECSNVSATAARSPSSSGSASRDG